MLSDPEKCYIIASAPRSGSTLLSSLMASTGLAGKPEEHFNPCAMGMAKDFPNGLVFDDGHVQKLIKKSTTSNGVFGTKAHFIQATNFVGLQRLDSLFPTPPQYIYIKREDDVRQAVSLAKAIQTNCYLWDQEKQQEPEYNYFQIAQCLREIRIQRKGWEVYFYEHNIQPFCIAYENFVTDMDQVILGALHYLKIDVPANFQVPHPALQKMADEMSEEWVARFLAEE